jgi:hypothetical protein
MLRRTMAAGVLISAVAAGASVPAQATGSSHRASQAPTTAVGQVRTLLQHAGRARSTQAAASGAATSASFTPTVDIDRRAVITFTVARKTVALPWIVDLPRAAGNYLAFYLPKTQQGWAFAKDPGSAEGWPALLWFGAGFGDPTLLPGRTYTVIVATDRPARVPMPFAMDIVDVTRTDFTVMLSSKDISLPVPTPATTGSMPDTLGDAQITSTAIALDWTADPSPLDDGTGDACPAASSPSICPGHNDLSYTNETFTSTVSGPSQVVFGEGFSRPEPGSVITGYGANVPTPFDAATLFAFGITPPR